MATEVKVGGYKDANALKEARRATSIATSKAETVMREVSRIREHVGRPDYGFLNSTLGELLLHLSRNSSALDEMWNLRAQAGQTVGDDVTTRVEMLEAQMAELMRRIGLQ